MIFNLNWNYVEDGNGFGFAQRLASGSNTIMYHPNESTFRTLIERKKEDIRTVVIMDTLYISGVIGSKNPIVTDTYAQAMAGTYGNTANWQIKCPKFSPLSGSAYTYATNAQDNTKMPIYRLADIKLLKAEALAMKSTPDLQGAIDIVNEIRTRAGYTVKALLVDYNTPDKVLNLIIDERRLEFWGEGKAWFDLVRNDKVKEYLDPVYTAYDPVKFPEGVGFQIGVAKPSPTYIGGYGRMLWPLNQDVFKKNPLMIGQQNLPYDE